MADANGEAAREADEEEQEDDSHEATSEDSQWRAPDCFAELEARLEQAGVADLSRSFFLGGLALWHTYGIWMAVCTNVGVSLVLLIRWYVGWLRLSMRQENGAFLDQCAFAFFAVFLRSFMLMAFSAELVRFCFWLARDAWRVDAFEAYRRLLCGQGRAELELGELYAVGWSRKVPGDCRLRLMDALVQCAIYVSFDFVPFVLFLRQYQGGSSLAACTVHAFQAVGVVAVVHVVLLFLAWTCTDVAVKVACLRKAMLGSRDFDQDAAEELLEEMEEELEEADSRGGEKDLLGIEAQITKHFSRSLTAQAPQAPARGRPGRRAEQRKRQPADDLNICVPTRLLAHLAAPHSLWPLLLAGGALLRSQALISAGFFVGLLATLYSCSKTQLWHHMMHQLPIPGCDDAESEVAAMQAWGETCCGLDVREQLRRRMGFAKTVMLQVILFMLLGWWKYVGVCSIFLIGAIVKQVSIHFERQWGWLVGLIEGMLLAVATAFLSQCFPTTATWTKGWPSMGILVLGVLRQFGLARRNPDCYRLMHAALLMLTIATLLIVGVVAYSAVTYDARSDYESGTSFCDPANTSTCRYYSVPFVPKDRTHDLTCPAWFSLGDEEQTLSISDFGMFSWVAYESMQTMPKALEHCFPGWWVVHSHFAAQDVSFLNSDWTTFFEYSSPDNATSVIAIRGTHSAIDALNDIVIWTPAVVMQGMGMLGPDIFPQVQLALASMVSLLSGNFKYTAVFDGLLSYVERRQAKEPNRKFYITGHSLGGGLAKLVAVKAHVRAVTFMAPGLSVTNHMVYRDFEPSFGNRQSEILTVQPDNDIVSRIDVQTGVVVPIACSEASPLYCHLVGPALCQIFARCGSGRKVGMLTMPCGICDEMPCPPTEASAGRWPWPAVLPGSAELQAW